MYTIINMHKCSWLDDLEWSVVGQWYEGPVGTASQTAIFEGNLSLVPTIWLGEVQQDNGIWYLSAALFRVIGH